jgi:23S rRNA pseudouridine2605 synthase
MRINRFVAQATGMSRRAADIAIAAGEILVNGTPAVTGQEIAETDEVTVKRGQETIRLHGQHGFTTIMLNKPAGYVCSRDGQGSKTVYDLLPQELHRLKPVGRLDKDSSGLLLITDDGERSNILTHPKFQKEKIYEIELNKPLASDDETRFEQGVMLEDGMSKLKISQSEASAAERNTLNTKRFTVTMNEGRNRQIRRTFAALGYRVILLNRTTFGSYRLEGLKPGTFRKIQS